MCYHRLTKSYLVLSKERKYLFCAYFCLTMKIPFKAIAALIILSLIGVFAYQAYWLTGIYLDEEGYGQLPDRNLTGERLQ